MGMFEYPNSTKCQGAQYPSMSPLKSLKCEPRKQVKLKYLKENKFGLGLFSQSETEPIFTRSSYKLLGENSCSRSWSALHAFEKKKKKERHDQIILATQNSIETSLNSPNFPKLSFCHGKRLRRGGMATTN
jgi:hypothetical protein